MLKFIPVTNYNMVIDGGAVNIRHAASLELLFYMAALEKWKPKLTESFRLEMISKTEFNL